VEKQTSCKGCGNSLSIVTYISTPQISFALLNGLKFLSQLPL